MAGDPLVEALWAHGVDPEGLMKALAYTVGLAIVIWLVRAAIRGIPT